MKMILESEYTVNLKEILKFFTDELLKADTEHHIQTITYNYDTQELTVKEEIEMELD